MSRSDPLLMLADIARLASEHPDLDEELVRGIYQHLVLEAGRSRRSTVCASTSAPRVLSRRRHPGSPRAPPCGSQRPSAPGRAAGLRAAPARPGSPEGHGPADCGDVREAHRAIRAERGRQPTQEELASALDVAVRSLQRFLKRHDMGWPLGE